MGVNVLKKRVYLSLSIFISISLLMSCSAFRNKKEVNEEKRSTPQIETSATNESDSIPLNSKKTEQTEKDKPKLEKVEIKAPSIRKHSRAKEIYIINRVNAISLESSSIINISYNGGAKYTAFFLDSPLRFVIDFEKTTLTANKPSISRHDPFIKRVLFINDLPEDYAKIEFYLKKKPAFNLQRFGNDLKLNFSISEAENKELKTIRTALSKREKEIAFLKSKVTALEFDREKLFNKVKKIDIEKETDEDKLKTIYARWINAWEKKDIDTFISFYSKRFTGRKMDLDQWRAHKKKTFEKFSEITVTAEDLKITIKNSRGEIQFIQNFFEDLYNDKGIKKLYLRREDGKWKIVKETWNPR